MYEEKNAFLSFLVLQNILTFSVNDKEGKNYFNLMGFTEIENPLGILFRVLLNSIGKLINLNVISSQ